MHSFFCFPSSEMQSKILKRALLLGYLFLTFVQSIIKLRALCVANIKGHSIKLSLHRVTHDGVTHPGVKTNIDNSAGVSKQTQDLGVKEAALSSFSRRCISRGSAWRGVTETWQGLRPRELICQEWAASLCQDHRRSRSQFVADLRGHKMGSSLIKPLVPCFRIVLLGLDNSGKTTILYRIKQNTFSQQRPTVGFNCETVGALWLWLFSKPISRDEGNHFDKSDKTGFYHLIQFAQFTVLLFSDCVTEKIISNLGCWWTRKDSVRI